MAIVITLIIITIFVTLIGSISVFLFKMIRGKNAAPISWSNPIQYRPGVGWFIMIILAGYHIGVHAALFVSGPVRFPALGWTIFSLCAAAAWVALFRKKITLLILSLIAVATMSGILVHIRANGFVQSFNVGLQIGASVLLLLIFIHDQMGWTISNLIRSLVSLIPLSFINVVRIVRSLFSRDAERSQKVVGWIKTLVIMFIALIVFISILSNADPVFSNLIEEFRSQLLDRTFASIGILLLLASVMSVIRSNTEEESSIGWLSYRDMVVSTTAVVIIVFIFLMVQFQYLFLGSSTMLRELDLTFSEYVRKGFTELLIAAFIGGIMSYLTTLKTRQASNNTHVKVATILNIILLVELGLLLVSALRRDVLYVETYGLTRVRIVGGVFLVWLFGFILSLANFSIFRKMRESRLLTVIWILTIAAWVGLNTFNIDRIVARGAPAHHEYTDYFYLMQLSEDAIDEKLSLLPAIRNEVEQLARKPNPTDIDKAQLAGLKLALITFVEKRDRLYLLYAPEPWLLQNGWQIGRQFETTDQSIWNADQVTQSIYKTNWAYPDRKRIIPKQLKKQRQIIQYNRAEAAAFTLLQANENTIFEPVNELIRDIRYYQIERQVPLYREETRLLREFTYPFLNVSLERYYPEELQRISPSNKSYNPQAWSVFEDLDRHQTLSPKSIQFYSCSTVPETLTTYGILKKGLPTTLETLANEPANISITIPSDLQLKRANNYDTDQKPPDYNSPAVIRNFDTPSTDWGYGEGVVVHLTLASKKQYVGSLCTVSYEATEVTEMLGF